MIEMLVRSCEELQPRLEAAGITVNLLLPEDETPKQGARLDASSDRGLAQLVLWNTGELDLVIAETGDGTVLLNEHREVTSELGIRDALITIGTHLSSSRGLYF